MAARYCVLLVILFLGKSQGAPVKTECPPSNPFDYHSADDARCDIFYKCANGQWVVQDCPSGLVFNPTSNNCDYPEDYECPYTTSTCPTCVNGNCDVATSLCVCDAGWSGSSCDQDVDECAAGTDTCQQICTNTAGSYTCSCDTGYTDNGDGTCTDIDECALGTDTCTDGVETCVNNEGGFTCSALSGPTCSPACQNGGTCVGTNTCSCPPMFIGATCEQFDVCFPINCQNGGTCVIANNQGSCTCPTGFTGSQCETVATVDDCTTTTLVCQNGGQCYDGNGAPECLCRLGYTGTECEELVGTGGNACDNTTLTCMNNGTCVDQGGVAVCDCVAPYTGTQCETDGGLCAVVNCLNGGTCQQDANGELSCICPDGYAGQFCELEVNCDGVVCLNEGVCGVVDNTAACICVDGTSGENCEIRQDCLFDGSPCQNGGECVDTTSGFVCACTFGWKGITCGTPRTCAGDFITCQNGGTCEDTADGAVCTCATGFTGSYCELIDDECGGCENNGTCRVPNIYPPDSTIYVCACPAGYGGDHCETSIACSMPCSPDVGLGGGRSEFFLWPDPESPTHAYLCREGQLQRIEACPDTAYNFYTAGCLTPQQYAAAQQGSSDLYYPPF